MKCICIPFLPGEVELCQDFAEKSYWTSKEQYKERGQENPVNTICQSRVGKLGELVTYRYLRDRGFTLDPPDIKIYPPEEKSWKHDLTVQGVCDIAVKSQAYDRAKDLSKFEPSYEQDKRVRYSWTFQYADKNGRQGSGHLDRLFSPEYGETLITPVIIVKDAAMIVGAVRMKDVVKEIEKNLPYLENLQSSKRVLYGDYLKSLPEEIRWRWPFNERD
jgi:disulfide oxidoreductase YuzD